MQSQHQIQLTDYQGSLFRRFTGKEKDSESGYYYFGARYFMPNLSIWNSVDPMADKYPSLSPYNYCAWNPIKLVDPNGEKLKLVIGTDANDDDIYYDVTSINDLPDDERMKIIRAIYNSGSEGQGVIQKILDSDKEFIIQEKMGYVGDHQVSEDLIANWGEPGEMHGGDSRHVLAEELYHCYQIAKGDWKFKAGEMTEDQKDRCEIDAKNFAARMFPNFNHFVPVNYQYFIPSQMDVMSSDDFYYRKTYLHGGSLPLYLNENGRPGRYSGMNYKHKGAYNK